MGVQENSNATVVTTPAKTDTQAEIDEKKRLANLKKKEKKKAKKTEETKEEQPAAEQVLDEAARKAALAEALKKR